MYVLLEQRTFSYSDNTKDVNVYVEYKTEKKENVEAMKIIKEQEAKLSSEDSKWIYAYQIVELVN